MKTERLLPSYRRAAQGRVHVFDASTMPWQDSHDPGLKLKPVRNDDALGEFLGLVSFAPFTRTALHQHQGVATSFVLDGGLTDYHGSLKRHEVGINLRRSTHDAMAYEHTVLAARLEGPVWYPPHEPQPSGLHAGSLQRELSPVDPAVPPEINVPIDELPRQPTGVAGLVRQGVFDYSGTGTQRRLVQWHLQPGARVPSCRATDVIELWVRGGELEVNGQRAHANCFVVIEPGATVAWCSPFGCCALVWADGPEQWPAGVAINLFGF
jgi:hypothetical protein